MATYIQWTTGTTYPSLDHYWRELSYNQMNVSGSEVVGWYTLPQPMSYYFGPVPAGISSSVNAIVSSAADPDVDFPRFWGINLQFNGEYRRQRWWKHDAHPRWSDQDLRHDMLYPGNSIADYAHEDGHALGLLHFRPDQLYDGDGT